MVICSGKKTNLFVLLSFAC